MSNVLLLSPTLSDAATLTASSEVASLPAVNMQAIQPAKVWRSTGTASEYFIFDFGAAVSCNCLALVKHNFSALGIIRVRAAATIPGLTGGSPALDTGAVSAWPNLPPAATDWPHYLSLVRWTAVSRQYWRIDIADATPVAAWFDIGRAVLGTEWQPSANFDLGGTPLGFAPVDVQTITPYGRTFTDRRTASPPRLFELAIYALTKREAFDGIYEMQRLRGLWGDVICVLDPAETTDFHRFAMQGVFTTAGAYTLPPAYDSAGSMFGAGIRLRELL